MRFFLTILFVLGNFSFAVGKAVEAIGDDTLVKVRLEKALSEIQIYGAGISYQGILSASSPFQKVAIPKRDQVHIQMSNVGGKPVWIVKRAGQVSEIASPFLALQGYELSDHRQALPKNIFLSRNRNNQFDVIGVLPLRDYLVGVVAGEMPLSWPKEALKAQVVAARSYALAVVRARKQQVFHLESTVLDQVFSRNRIQSEKKKIAEGLVAETADMILLGANKRILKAFYHSDCGGHPSSEKAVWGNGSSLRAIAGDQSCPVNPKASWSLQVSDDDIVRSLRRVLKLSGYVPIAGLDLLRPLITDRVTEMSIRWEDGSLSKMLASDFRAVLGYDRLKSTQFEVRKDKESWVFEGRGYGHGVGLCQWGARHRAQAGETYIEILKNYYPMAEIEGAKQISINAVHL